MDVEVYEFEPGRWSYKVGGVPSGETFPSHSAALIAADHAQGKQDEAPEATTDGEAAIDPQI